MTASIRRVRADEWAALRELRLRALAGAPHMFGSTLAEDAGAPVAMASCYVEDGIFLLIQMWVDERVRRQGLGAALVDAVIGWAAAQGARFVRLAVNPDDAAAPALYRALGFVDTGRREPDLFHGRAGEAMVMERRL